MRKQYTSREFARVLLDNGYELDRQKGSHKIYVKGCNSIVVPLQLNMMIARRLIKENKLIVEE